MSDLAVLDNSTAALMERVVVDGDLSKLTPAQRLDYYRRVCESLGLNPYSKPFDYLNLGGKLVLYARKDATEQLRRINGVSVEITGRELQGDIDVVTARARDKHGRTDEAIGAVYVGGLKGDALANAYMKAETKAKRRVTLSICGLGWLDETETETIPDAHRVEVDHETGEIKTPLAPPRPVREEARPATSQNGKSRARRIFERAVAMFGDEEQAADWIRQVTGRETMRGMTETELDDLERVLNIEMQAFQEEEDE